MPCPSLFYKSPIKQAIFDFIRTHPGCTRNQIINSVYADDPNGGPENVSIISAHLQQMRPTLTAAGIAIRCDRSREASGYYVVPL